MQIKPQESTHNHAHIWTNWFDKVLNFLKLFHENNNAFNRIRNILYDVAYKWMYTIHENWLCLTKFVIVLKCLARGSFTFECERYTHMFVTIIILLLKGIKFPSAKFVKIETQERINRIAKWKIYLLYLFSTQNFFVIEKCVCVLFICVCFVF